jgi:hypothetical protein
MSIETSNIIREPTYLAARAVAPTIEAHFGQHIATARQRGEEELAPEPDTTND